MVNTDTYTQNTAMAHSLTPATTLWVILIEDDHLPEPDTRKPIPTGQDAGLLKAIQLPQPVHGVTTSGDHSIDWPDLNHETPESP